jgi:hypothetical protein
MGDVIRFITRGEVQEMARHLTAETMKELHRRTAIAVVNGYDIIAASNADGRMFLVHGHSDDRAFLELEDAEAFAGQQPLRER